MSHSHIVPETELSEPFAATVNRCEGFFVWSGMMAANDAMLTADDARRLFSYNKKTGVMRRKVSVSTNAKAGDVAGGMFTKRTKRYLRVGANGVRHLVHRVVWLVITGNWPDHDIDHIDGNGMNNRWKNLRCVTKAENKKNVRRQSNNVSGHTGVALRLKTKMWISRIRVLGKDIHIGCFSEIEEAIAARKKAEKEHGFHENHGSDRPL